MLGLLYSLFTPNSTLAFERTVGTVTKNAGQVYVKKIGQEQSIAVNAGMVISEGDTLHTESDGFVQITLRDGNFINITKSSSLRINQYDLDAVTNRRSMRCRILQGRVRLVFFQPVDGGIKIYIQTSHAVITPRAQSDSIITVADNETFVAVLGGSVGIESSLSYVVGEVRLMSDRKVTVKNKMPPSDPIPISSEERRSYLQETKGL